MDNNLDDELDGNKLDRKGRFLAAVLIAVVLLGSVKIWEVEHAKAADAAHPRTYTTSH